MPYRPDGDFLQDDDQSRWDDMPQEAEGGGWWKWAVAVASLAIFGGVLWYAYTTGATGPIGPVRTVEAEIKPYKVKPQEPGGEIIPDQDKLVFNEAVGRSEDTEDMLGEGPEMPQAKPEAVAVRKFKPPPPANKPEPPTPPPAEPGQAIADAAPAVPGATPPASPAPPATPGAATTAAPVAAPKADAAKVPLPATPTQTTVAVAQSSEATPPPPVTEAKPATSGSPVVQLGAYGSSAGAMEAWAQVQKKQGDVVASLSPQVIKFTPPGKAELYRLVIGPFADRASATQVCGQLKAQGRDCIVNAN